MSQRVMTILERIEYRLATTEQDRDLIYRLRYDSYLREDAIEENETKRLADDYDASPNGGLFGIHLDGLLVASIRLHIVNARARHSPAASVFPEALAPLVEQGLTIVDPNRFVVDRAMDQRVPELPYVVLRLPFMAAGWFDAEIVTATVRREHAAFYAKILRCRSVCDPRLYPTLTKPLGLMMVNYPIESLNVLARHPCFGPRPGELEAVFGPMGMSGAPMPGLGHC